MLIWNSITGWSPRQVQRATQLSLLGTRTPVIAAILWCVCAAVMQRRLMQMVAAMR